MLDLTLPPLHPGIPHKSPYKAPNPPAPHCIVPLPVAGRLGTAHNVYILARILSKGTEDHGIEYERLLSVIPLGGRMGERVEDIPLGGRMGECVGVFTLERGGIR